MPRSEKQKLKLYYIIDMLRRLTDEEHPVSVSDIIEYLAEIGIQAERKSIYRDIEAIKLLGYDIIQLQRRQNLYYMGSREFENAELRLLVDAVQASRFITKTKSNALIKKLENLTTEYDAVRLQSQVYVTNRIKSSNESIYYNVDIIHNAIGENKKISFQYFDWDINKRKVYRHDGKKYIISPWALIWDNEFYYLIGYDSETEKIKHYRVDRMAHLDSCDEKREGRSAFRDVDIAKYAQRFFSMYDGKTASVTLCCDKSLTNAVIDRFGSGVRFEPQQDGEHFKVEVNVAVSPVFLSWVIMFGGKIRIDSPVWVKEELKKLAESALFGID